MKSIYPCPVIRDLLPLYTDGVCSDESRLAVDDHLRECPDCRQLCSSIKNEEIGLAIKSDVSEVLEHQKRKFKRKSVTVGTVFGGILTVPILICLIVNLAVGSGLDWFFIVFTALLLAASLTVVPLLLSENRFLWTLGAFTVCLELLLLVCSLYTGGKWFPVASSATLFGLSAVFLPAVVRAKSLAKLPKRFRTAVVLGIDTLLYGWMMLSVWLVNRPPEFEVWSVSVSLPVVGFIWILYLFPLLFGKGKWKKAGIRFILWGCFLFFAEWLIGKLSKTPVSLPHFSFFVWNAETLGDRLLWAILLGFTAIGIFCFLMGSRKNQKK